LATIFFISTDFFKCVFYIVFECFNLGNVIGAALVLIENCTWY